MLQPEISSPLLLDLRELPDYPSNVVLRSVLEALGADVLEPGSSGRRRRVPPNATLVVPYPAHRRIFRHASINVGRSVKIIAVPLVLLHDSRIIDRQEEHRYHPTALAYRSADLLMARLADLVVSDTDSHASLIARRLRVPVQAARLGSAVELLRPDLVARGPAPFDGILRFVHYGNFFPIQGVSIMIESMARLGAQYSLDLVGRAPEDLVLPPNVTIHRPLAAADLYELMTTSHVLLGQFGDTPQRDVVIPTKVYDALSLGLPVITAAGREIERHGDVEALELVRPDDVDALMTTASTLMRSALDGRLLALQRSASTAYDERFSVACARSDWVDILGTID